MFLPYLRQTRLSCISSKLAMFATGVRPALSSVVTDDAGIIRILQETKVIAMVGASPTAGRPSYKVMEFLQGKGYRILPVNPVAAEKGDSILGETAYASLESIPEDLRSTVDMVDIFRKPEEVGDIVEEAIRIGGIKTIWMQLGIEDPEAAARANAAGMEVVMDRCPKIEYPRLIDA